MSTALRAAVDLREILDEDQRGILGRIVSNGGSMHQQALAQCVDYSEAKLCGLLRELVDNGHLKKVPYGRENVLYLPGCEPAFLHDPRDEDGDEE
jgi:uncharacterized membrane protein